ncbi:A disintegrin and metalloproteinase with thrombospondin motifs 6-like [Physella acuta]|uniref:A disintegrin and metalloproteinase with thrombospondin motifs 6-like n=1 Tax=Physella acuta TaxID=109671 RepID=UPI0027DC8CD3|nr:A disintegrin and metalloproteinase with thrombospondin motifs 6-like [Physella acuta]
MLSVVLFGVLFMPSWSLNMFVDREFLQRKTDDILEQLNHFETTIPQLVDHRGNFLSYDVRHSSVLRHTAEAHSRGKRSAKRPSGKKSKKSKIFLDERGEIGRSHVFYKLSANGREFHLNLTLNNQLLSKDFAVEFLGKSSRTKSQEQIWDCHYTGASIGHDGFDAAISNCNGLHGVFSTDTDDYFVEPLWNHTNVVGVEGHPHVVYSRSSLKLGDLSKFCGVTDHRRKKYTKWYRKRPGNQNDVLKPKHQSPFWKWRPKLKQTQKQPTNHSANSDKAKKRARRSASIEKHVETLVVVDKKMLDYHLSSTFEGSRAALTAYVLTIMNIVAKLFHNPTIGNALNIVVTRIFFLESEQGDNLPVINHHADMSLDNFCKWQYNFTAGENSSDYSFNHDNAVLITRYDICTYKNDPCGTLGLAAVEGMCNKLRSCSIIQDIGLASAFTIAHEIGHNIGMHHDGDGNQCGTPGKEPAQLMATRLSKETSSFHWSSCSRKYVTDFLDSGQGWCLDNVPLKRDVYPRDLPGDVYDMNAQCRFQFGPTSKACKFKYACLELWCMNDNSTCETLGMPAAEGTECSMPRHKKGWCYHGECRNPKYESVTVHGSWGPWGGWGECSRTCEGGVSTSERECDNPQPKDGGRYCIGQRRRYRSCNVTPCPAGSEDFRHVQCSSFNEVPFRGKLYKWVPYSGNDELSKVCSLVCMADGQNFYTERSPKVKDGTKCYSDLPHVCINGECNFVGCDGYLGSQVKEDNCRVCGGDNSACKTISGLFDKPLPRGDYQEVVTIPKGAMHIKVSEAKFSRNYLALKDTKGNSKENYFINGDWTIDWPRRFRVAGTVFTYRLAEHEPESLRANGPTSEDLVIMILMQEDNRGILYQYTLPINKTDKSQPDISLFTWAHSPWTPCSKSCSTGTSTSKARCVNKSDGRTAENSYCDRQPRPSDHTRKCNEQPCPPKWSWGPWSECSQSCGEGHRSRQVVCLQLVGDNDQIVLDDTECTETKPPSESECHMAECPPEWHTFEWTECVPSCGPGEKTRRVFCMPSDASTYLEDRRCKIEDKPPQKMACSNRDCPPPQWRKGEWSQCSVTCGEGTQVRLVQCQSFTSETCDPKIEPKASQKCNSSCDKKAESLTAQAVVCVDKFRVAYCPLVLKFGYCKRTYFQTMCCETCSKGENTMTSRRRRHQR